MFRWAFFILGVLLLLAGVSTWLGYNPFNPVRSITTAECLDRNKTFYYNDHYLLRADLDRERKVRYGSGWYVPVVDTDSRLFVSFNNAQADEM